MSDKFRGLDVEDKGTDSIIDWMTIDELLDREPKQFRTKGLEALVDRFMFSSVLCLREEYKI